MRLLLKSLEWYIKTYKVKNVNNFVDKVFGVLNFLGTLITFLCITGLGYMFNMFWEVIILSISILIIRVDKGEHYDTFSECFITSLLITILYVMLASIFNSLLYHIVLAICFGFYFRNDILHK